MLRAGLFLLLCGLPATAQPAAKIGPELQTVASFSNFRTLGLGVSRTGRVFASAPSAGSPISVVEVDTKTGALTPYPNADWNTPSPDPAKPQWVSVQAMTVDAQDHLWVLDSARPRPGRPPMPQRLVVFDLSDNHILHNFSFDGVMAQPDALNDVAVDLEHGYAYLTNAANQGSLAVLDIATGKARQVLVADRSTKAMEDQHLMLNGQVALRLDGTVYVTQADGLALSPDRQWLYYRPLTDHEYYRIRTADLRDQSLTPQQMSARVQHLGSAEMTGGLIMDGKGRLYGGDLEHASVVMLTYDEKAKKLSSHVFVNQPGRLAWADGFAISQGWLYISDSHLNETNYQNGLPRSGNWSIFRVKLPP